MEIFSTGLQPFRGGVSFPGALLQAMVSWAVGRKAVVLCLSVCSDVFRFAPMCFVAADGFGLFRIRLVCSERSIRDIRSGIFDQGLVDKLAAVIWGMDRVGWVVAVVRRVVMIWEADQVGWAARRRAAAPAARGAEALVPMA